MAGRAAGRGVRGGRAREDGCSLTNLTDLDAAFRQSVIKNMNEVTKPVRRRLMENLGQTVNESALADPDMPKFLRGPMQRGLNLFWGDLKASLDMALDDSMEQAVLGQTHNHLYTMGEQPFTCGFNWWRARLLYCVLPFDKSIFGQAKDPWFWVTTVASMVTSCGIRTSFYTLLLVSILWEEPDEFQVVQFITLIKGTFFLSAGVISAARTAFLYLKCVHPGGCHTCDINGPAYVLDLKSQAVDFFGGIFLTWAAFFSLRFTVHHGWHKMEAEEMEAASHHSHGGHLMKLFKYDFACILISFLLFIVLAWEDAGNQEAHLKALRLRTQLCQLHGVVIEPQSALPSPSANLGRWDYHRSFLFARMFYALLSTPFVLFKLPVLNTILTHTTQTGYNKQGKCVIYCMRPL